MLNQFNSNCSIFLNRQTNRIFFLFVSALLYSLTLPYFGWGFYAWFALIPLMMLIKSSKNFIQVSLESFVFFVIYNLISFSWLTGIHPLDWQGLSKLESFVVTGLAWLLPTFFHSVVLIPFALAAKAFYKYFTNNKFNELSMLHIALLSFLWVSIQHKLLFNLGADLGAFSVPVNLLVYSNYSNLPLLQITQSIGAIGLEYLMVFFSLALSNFLNVQSFLGTRFQSAVFCEIQNPIRSIRRFAVLLLVIISVYILGICKLFNNHSYKSKSKTFAIVQPDHSAAASRSPSQDPKPLIDLQLTLSSKINKPLDFLIWTEGAVPILDRTWLESTQFARILSLHKSFIFGTYHEDSEKIFNSIEFLSSEQGQISKQFYDKNLLVPFGEYTPWYRFFPTPLRNLARSTVGEGFSPANKTGAVVELDGLVVGPSICFELLFPSLIRKSVENGAQILLNLNDLSWFKNFYDGNLIQKQFLALAVFRAVENNRDLILAGNSGYSALISSDGRIKSLATPNSLQILRAKVSSKSKLSLFTKYGW